SRATSCVHVSAGDSGARQRAFLLNIVANGTAVPFTSNPIGATQLSGRQVVVQEQNSLGLNITRKVYVPQYGYFTRYLEILNNPTSAPINVDLQVTDNVGTRQSELPEIVMTSSGDNLLDVSTPGNADQWLVVHNLADTNEEP